MRNIHGLILKVLLRQQGLKPLQEILIMSSTCHMQEFNSGGDDNNISPNHELCMCVCPHTDTNTHTCICMYVHCLFMSMGLHELWFINYYCV